MSLELLTLAWRADLPNGSDKLVLLALADFANGDAQAWPSNDTLAAKCSRSEQTVRDALRRLARDGHVTREERSGRTTRFIVHPRFTPPEIHEGSENCEGSENQQGYGNSEGSEDPHPTPPESWGATPPNIQPGPLPISRPEPFIEPPIEPSLNRSDGARRDRVPKTIDPAWRPKVLSETMAGNVEHWSAERLEREREKFVNHHGEKRTVSPDWDARWRTWLLNGLDYEEKSRERSAGAHVPSCRATERHQPPPNPRFAAAARRVLRSGAGCDLDAGGDRLGDAEAGGPALADRS